MNHYCYNLRHCKVISILEKKKNLSLPSGQMRNQILAFSNCILRGNQWPICFIIFKGLSVPSFKLISSLIPIFTLFFYVLASLPYLGFSFYKNVLIFLLSLTDTISLFKEKRDWMQNVNLGGKPIIFLASKEV